MSPDYATICGYTQSELEFYFADYIKQFAQSKHTSEQELLERIKRWYNGYSWDGTTSVYNPFSTLLLLIEKEFRDYWFATGTPTFLVNLIKERNDVRLFHEPIRIQSSGFDSFDYKTLDTKLLLFQTGYLTVKSTVPQRFGDGLEYTLGIPNKEVHCSLTEHLLASFAAYPMPDTAPMRDRMLGQLWDGDVRAFERSMQAMFACIPYQLHVPLEAYYHSLFLLWLDLLGFNLFAEVSTDKGRLDAVWTWEERVVIVEIKFSEKGATEPLLKEAFAQIHERRYYERYAGGNHRIALLAVAFAGKEIACKMEEL
jgi:hypothetical protein